MKLKTQARQEFAELYALGWTYESISKALEVTKRALFYWRREMHLPRRPRGRKSLTFPVLSNSALDRREIACGAHGAVPQSRTVHRIEESNG